MDSARHNGLVKGVLEDNIEGGFLLQDDFDSAHNLKFIFCLFEQMSGLKTNFHKSELFLFFGRGVVDKANSFAEIFTCPIGSLPM